MNRVQKKSKTALTSSSSEESSQRVCPSTQKSFRPSAWTHFTFCTPLVREVKSSTPGGTSVTIRLPYRLSAPSTGSDSPLVFCERFEFPAAKLPDCPARRAALERLTRLLSLAAGVSYCKAALPLRFQSEFFLTPRQASFFSRLYRGGLGEFAARNQLDIREGLDFQLCKRANSPEPLALNLTPRPLLPMGGGKDSLVSYSLLTEAGFAPVITWVGAHQRIRTLAEHLEGECREIGRKLDPLLFALNEQGAYNGHVPITGILAFSLLIAAVLYDCDAVVLSNERSASEGNRQYYGEVINHQYSKSFAFERDLQELLKYEVSEHLQYFSLLRPYSELAITGHFSSLSEFFPYFSSCNRSFTIKEEAQTRAWCGRCPKCAFVYLALSPHLTPETLYRIFGKNLFEDPDLTTTFEELCGLSGEKPFECVGELQESALAFCLAAKRPEWSGSPLVLEFASRLQRDSLSIDMLTERYFSAAEDHRIPSTYQSALTAFRGSYGTV